MGQRDSSGLERYDRVWCVQWVFPRDYPSDLPRPVIETVREVAAGLGVALTDAHDDNHDDIDGGDPPPAGVALLPASDGPWRCR